MIAKADFKNHWSESLSIEEYHANKNFLSNSGLKHALRSLEHFKAFVLDGEPKESTSAMKFGQIVHTALLEPEKFEKNLRIEPEINRRSSIERASLEVWKQAQGPNAVTVAADDLKIVRRIRDRLHQHEVARGLMTIGDREWSGFARCPETGLGLKARPDFMDRDRGFLMDVKTTTDVRKEAFRRTIEKYRYDVQAWFYRYVASLVEGRPFERFYILAIEKTAPYPVTLHMIDPAFDDIAERHTKKILRQLKVCFETNTWPPIQTEAEMIGPSDWFLKRAEDEMMFEEEENV